MDHARYRADIDGLRAIAVLSVLLFHVDVPAFSGGYVGVDVFFVISGFLITRLIRDEVLKTGTFSFANFYLRRARRLLPSFFFTLSLSFVTAFFLFPRQLLAQFSRSLFYSVISLANFLFWSESGYFDAAATYKPLLHIWSLSVEEQFYLLWPLLLVLLLLKTPRRAVPAALVLGFALSLYMNFVFADGSVYLLTNFFPGAAAWIAEGGATIFYLMPFRIFEFAIGALTVWIVERQPQNKLWLEPLALIGLALIVYPTLAYTETTLFPSYNALAPCLGAALLIYGGESRYGGSLLRTPLLVEIGKISYSLYLLHWPAIVFYKYYIYDFGALAPLEQIALCAAAILAARFTYIYVEQPFRKSAGGKKEVPTRTFLVMHAALGIILFALAFNASSDGWQWRTPNSVDVTDEAIGKEREAFQLNDACNIFDLKAHNCNPDAPLQVLSLGDSHNYVGYYMFQEAFRGRQDINLIAFYAATDCAFSVEDGKIKARQIGTVNKGMCRERAAALNNPDFGKRLDVLVLSSLNLFERDLELPIIAYLKSQNKDLKVIIVGNYISVRPYTCADIVSRFGSAAFCKDERFVSVFGDNVNAEYYDEYMQYDPLYINAVNMFCEQGTLANCLVEAGGAPMFYDGDHLTVEFSFLMGRQMLENYADELEKIGFPAMGK
jgi:peptidoglycan/LPS O-acetylase OafA/YrhL